MSLAAIAPVRLQRSGSRRRIPRAAYTGHAPVMSRPCYRLSCGAYPLLLGRRTLVMGILNVTPDSFSDGGRCATPSSAARRGLVLVAEGADLIDVGGESTRPGARPVSAREERARVVPVIRSLARRVRVPISVDTSKADVAEAALDAGASLVNDVTALRGDRRMAAVVARAGVPVVLMHRRGSPRTMQRQTRYRALPDDVIAELRVSIDRALEAGIASRRLLIDPGLGFAKTAGQSLLLLRTLPAWHALGHPLLVGPSRKSFIGAVLNAPVGERLCGTAACVALAIVGGAHIVRVHDVRAMVQVARMTDAILNAD